MDAEKRKYAELEASEVLLDLGVSFPLKALKLPFLKRPVLLRLKMKRPYLGTRIRVAREYLKMNVKASEMEEFDKEQQVAFLSQHGKGISLIVAKAVLRSPVASFLFANLLAWVLRWAVDERFLYLAFWQFIKCQGTENFTNIIACIERTNPLMPVSHEKKGS